MSEKPQAAREEQEDLLEEIFTQGLEKINASAQAAVGPEEADAAPRQEGAGENSPSAKRKSRRSAAYLYLLILFGAAFLMLLLAYFVQQRSSENTISDLQESMNLSRKELLDEIKNLKEQNDALSKNLNTYKEGYSYWMERYEETRQEANDLWDQNNAAQQALYSWQSFWELERYYQAGDLANCAVLLILQEMGQYPYRAPDAARQAEIVRAVIDAGILDEYYYTHTWQYNDLLDAYFANSPVLYGAELVLTAQTAGETSITTTNVSRETER